MKNLIKIYFIFIPLAFSHISNGQQVIDEVIGIVGNEPVLLSELEYGLQQFKDLDQENIGDARCWVMDQLLLKKLLLSRAKTDSLKVTDEQVNDELDRRINFFVSQIGSESALEEYYGKSIEQIKNEFRENIHEQLLIDQMQSKITGNVDISPSEVRKFFNDIPKDSLPYYNTELEVGQIVLYPTVSKDARNTEIELLKKIKTDLEKGSKFSTLAILYSEDRSNATKGGCLGTINANTLVPEFSAVALSLKKDSVSEIVETKYGYHLIKMLDRKGDMINVCHILRIPKVSTEDQIKIAEKLDSIRNMILLDSLTFESAAYKYSRDEETRNRGGMLIDPKTNSSRIPVDEIDSRIFIIVDKLKTGGVSEVEPFVTADGKNAYRILYLRSKTPPHKANFEQDYAKLKIIAQEYKKSELIDEWVKKYSAKTFIKFDDSFKGCEHLEKWQSSEGDLGKK